jgi:alanine racemase
VLLGSQGDARLEATDLARACDTIAYEVLTSISPRVPRNH